MIAAVYPKQPLRLASPYPQSACPSLDDCKPCQDPDHDAPCCLTHCATCRAICRQPEEISEKENSHARII